MPKIFNEKNLSFDLHQSPVPEFAWHRSLRLSDICKSRNLDFDVKSLDSGKYSYPYHFHRNAEELFVILSGKVMLRTPDGYKELAEGDIIYFETGPSGAHQLYNHTALPCNYLDIRTINGIDVCEYPDSGKINILPYQEVYETKEGIDYFKGEDKVSEKWPKGIVGDTNGTVVKK